MITGSQVGSAADAMRATSAPGGDDDSPLHCAPLHSTQPASAERLSPPDDVSNPETVLNPRPLELGWTRLGRRPPPSSASSSIGTTGANGDRDRHKDRAGSRSTESDENGVVDDDDDFWLWQGSCWAGCSDPSCDWRREGPLVFRRRRFSKQGTAAGAGGGEERLRIVRGQAVWLLPSGGSGADLDWFQGYLFLSHDGDSNDSTSKKKRKPLGLLAENLEIDECLACADGGYRRLAVRLYEWNPKVHSDSSCSSSSSSTTTTTRKIQQDLGEADWTGGDMMKLSGENVRMRPIQLLTGRSAAPYVTGLFASLWNRIVDHSAGYADPKRLRGEREESNVDGNDINSIKSRYGERDLDANRLPNVLEVLPDVVVVWGDMEVILDTDS